MLTKSNLLDPKKLPQDTIQIAIHPQAGGAGEGGPPISTAPSSLEGVPGTGGFGGAAASVAPTQQEIEKLFAEEEEEDLARMGLGGSAKPKGKQCKKKRTRTEIIADEIVKIKSDWASCVQSLDKFPEHPKSKEMGRQDRVIQAKIKEMG